MDQAPRCDVDKFRGIMAIVYALMMCGCFYLASKMARGMMTRMAFMAVTLFLVFVLGCLVIKLPLNENQPRIIVSFLVLPAQNASQQKQQVAKRHGVSSQSPRFGRG